jgi:hypothetical protein
MWRGGEEEGRSTCVPWIESWLTIEKFVSKKILRKEKGKQTMCASQYYDPEQQCNKMIIIIVQIALPLSLLLQVQIMEPNNGFFK